MYLCILGSFVSIIGGNLHWKMFVFHRFIYEFDWNLENGFSWKQLSDNYVLWLFYKCWVNLLDLTTESYNEIKINNTIEI